MKIKEFNSLKENYIRQLNDFANPEPFHLFYLFNMIQTIKENGEKIDEAFILSNNDCKIVNLCFNGHYCFYGKNWTKTEIEYIRKRVNFDTIPENFHFVGTKGLIVDIFKGLKINTVDFKDRYFYKFDNNSINYNPAIVITRPNKNDIKELSELIQLSHIEEYQEHCDIEINPLDYLFEAIQYVSESKIIINKNSNKITGFYTFSKSQIDFPLIGTLYIKKDYRNKGIGKELLRFATEILIKEQGNACFVATEKKNFSANKVMENVGYKKIYEHIDKVTIK